MAKTTEEFPVLPPPCEPYCVLPPQLKSAAQQTRTEIAEIDGIRIIIPRWHWPHPTSGDNHRVVLILTGCLDGTVKASTECCLQWTKPNRR